MTRPHRAPRGRPRVSGASATAPEGQAWLHHGLRLLLLLGLAGLATLLLPPDRRLRVAQYEEGMVAERDVLAQVRFNVPVPPEELERARQEAQAAVPPTFDLQPEAADTTEARLERFFDRLEGAVAAEGEGPVSRVLSERSIRATPAQLELLRDEDRFEQIRRAGLRAAREILPTGVADGSDLAEVSTTRITVRDPGGATERSVPRSEVLSGREFLDRAVGLLPASAPPDAQEILRLILIQHVEYTYRLNLQATELDREGAIRAVPTTREEVLPGQVVVRGGEIITSAVLARLEAYQDALRTQGLLAEGVEVRLSPLVGAVLLNLIVLGVFGLFVLLFRNEVYTNTRWISLVAILIGLYLVGTAVVVRSGWPVEAFPVVFSVLAVAVLWDGRMALVLAMTLAALSSLQAGLPGSTSLVPTFLGGAAAGMSVRLVRRRAQTWIFIAVIFSGYALAIISQALLTGRALDEVGVSLAAAGMNSIVSTILAMGFIPVFELFTRITTDQTLLEWADPNRPLLRRLSLEAPGTYAHTISVVNLAEAAANAIGADGLLTRVGLYYHDVGKVLKPYYFVENQPEGQNPHDRLKPDTSAAIVREHITGGMKLAREAKVPDVIADFIVEHHGTQSIGFFYERAREEYGEENVDPADYAYPGPRPRSRETAIAMLADSVESATRALKDPTPERIKDLVDSIVDSKLAAHQLDEAPLTFQELALIKEQFVKVLSGVYHQRIDYPQTKHLTDAPSAEGDGAGTGGGGAPEAGVDAAHRPGRADEERDDDSLELPLDDVPEAERLRGEGGEG